MRIAVIGATGKQGNLVVQEALKRGYDVTAIVRDKAKITSGLVKVIEKDIFDITAEDVKNFDVVVDAFRAPSGKEEQHETSMKSLIRVFEAVPDTRLLVVGGAGSLYVDPEKTMQVMNTEGFPEEFKPTASNMGKGFEALKKSGVNWTYFSPAADFDFSGIRTGSYTLGEDNLIVNKGGESYVSYADYAVALVDEIERKDHIRKRFTAVSERA